MRRLHLATRIGDLDREATALEEALLAAGKEVGLLRTPKKHNPNQLTKARPRWFDLECREA